MKLEDGMPKIKTRKAVQESMRQLQQSRHPQKEENTPEAVAVSKVEDTTKHAIQDTTQLIRKHIRKRIQPSKGKNVKRSIRTAKSVKEIGQAIITGVKTATQIAEATGKAVASAIASGGWIAFFIILVIGLVVFLGTSFFTEEGGGGLVAVARSQVGNSGGEEYWSWYGYSSRVEWCACFVSWCGEQCGYLEEGILPQYSNCTNGVEWFQERGLWLEGSSEPTPGMIIFFDWNKEDTNGQDGLADHTGIVAKVENNTIASIEGNSNDRVEINTYSIGNKEILGYGILAYMKQTAATP